MNTIQVKPGVRIELGVNAKGYPTAHMYKTKTAGKNKGTEQRVWAYYFSSEQSRATYVNKQLLAVHDAELQAESRKLLKAETLKKVVENKVVTVGSIFVESWGYEQTNIDFYQVIAVNGCMLTLQEIASEAVAGTQTYMSADMMPVPNKFIDEPIKRKLLITEGENDCKPYIKPRSFSHASLWDGRAYNATWYA